MNKEPKKTEEQETGSAWINIGKIVLLITILVLSWFVLERFMGSK
jgi:hypothetical protein